MYPSIQSNSRGVNFAVNPNFVTNHMYVDRFYIIKVNDISKNKKNYNISFSDYGTVVNNLTHWKKITESDDVFEGFVKTDFGQSFYDNLKTGEKL